MTRGEEGRGLHHDDLLLLLLLLLERGGLVGDFGAEIWEVAILDSQCKSTINSGGTEIK